MPNQLVVQTAQGAVLSATSNVLAQAVEAYQKDVPFQLRLQPIITFVIFAILNTPPNGLWQQYLEDTFPGKKKNAKGEQTLHIPNTIKKFLLDQSIGALVNNILFITYVNGVKGASGAQIWEALQRDMIPLLVAGSKIWPLVSILSFTVIPVEHRIVFGSAVGVLWGVYLSLLAAKA